MLKKFEGQEPVLISKIEKKYREKFPAYIQNVPTLEEAMKSFYAKHQPDKLDDIPLLLKKYEGKEASMVEKIEKKYGDKFPPWALPTAAAVLSNTSSTSVSESSPSPGGDSKVPSLQEALKAFYVKNAPDKIDDIPILLQKYTGQEAVMVSKIEAKYNDKFPVYLLPNGQSSASVSSVSNSTASATAASTPAASTASAPAADATASASSAAAGPLPTLEEALKKYYTKNAPDKLEDIPILLQKYAGRDTVMVQKLEAKYSDKFPAYKLSAAEAAAVPAAAAPAADTSAPASAAAAPAVSTGTSSSATAAKVETPVAENAANAETSTPESDSAENAETSSPPPQ